MNRRSLNRVRFSVLSLVLLLVVALSLPGLVRGGVEIFNQNRQIASDEKANANLEAEIARLDQETANWSDDAYIATQGRQRFGLVKPGEVSFLVVDDLPKSETTDPARAQATNTTAEYARINWGPALLASLVQAGSVAATRLAEKNPQIPAPKQGNPQASSTPSS